MWAPLGGTLIATGARPGKSRVCSQPPWCATFATLLFACIFPSLTHRTRGTRRRKQRTTSGDKSLLNHFFLTSHPFNPAYQSDSVPAPGPQHTRCSHLTPEIATSGPAGRDASSKRPILRRETHPPERPIGAKKRASHPAANPGARLGRWQPRGSAEKY